MYKHIAFFDSLLYNTFIKIFFGIIEKLMVSQVSTELTLKLDYHKTFLSYFVLAEEDLVLTLGSAAFRRTSFFMPKNIPSSLLSRFADNQFYILGTNKRRTLEGEITMKHIVVDLEMNNLAKRFHAERSICRMEAIEIGAVVLDEDYSENVFHAMYASSN